MDNQSLSNQESESGKFLKKSPSTDVFNTQDVPEEAIPKIESASESICENIPAADISQTQDTVPAPEAVPEKNAEPNPPSEDNDTAVHTDKSAENETHPLLTVPELTDSIAPDEDAYAFHGMTAPGEEQEPLDMDAVDALTESETSEGSEEVPTNVHEEPKEVIQPAASDTAPSERPVRKGRPKRKKGEGLFGIPNIMVMLVWMGLCLLIGVTLGRMVWVCASDVLAFGRPDKNVSVTIYESDSIEVITEKLHNAGLIRYPELFKLYASFAVDEGEIHAGMWDLNTKYDYHALVKMMSPSSSREVIKVMIPEGYTCRQIFDVLEENKVCTVQDLESYAANGELNDYWFLEGVNRGDKYCLEGFLFPDTYEFYKNDSPRNVLAKMLNNFDNRFEESLRWDIDQLNGRLTDWMRSAGRGDEYIAGHLFTVREVVIVASMIERETANTDESYMISSVIFNRLFRWGSTPAYLNIDATVIYALNGKTNLTLEDLRVDSPYNTYLNVGLTPGPISNPGLASLKAALAPADSDFYFYILDPSVGTHHFSRTQEEHEAFRAALGG